MGLKGACQLLQETLNLNSSISQPESQTQTQGIIPEPSVITWTPKVCKLMALMAAIMGLGLLFYILFGFSQP